MKKLLSVITGFTVTFFTLAQLYTINNMKQIPHGTAFTDNSKVKLCLQLPVKRLKINSDPALLYANKSYSIATAINFYEGLANA